MTFPLVGSESLRRILSPPSTLRRWGSWVASAWVWVMVSGRGRPQRGPRRRTVLMFPAPPRAPRYPLTAWVCASGCRT